MKDSGKNKKNIQPKVGLVNLGCARNLVDSQAILGQFSMGKGHEIVDVEESDVAIVNTCAFIDEAKNESIEAILDLIELKKQGKIKKIIVSGCLAQRYSKELAKEFKEVDEFRGVEKLDRQKIPEQVSLTASYTAYLKICESCFNQCSFCIIPAIKGKFISRTMESILTEVKQMDVRGVKEINIIGQDITAYGMDIYHEKTLAKLLKSVAASVVNIKWIRLLYAFPAHVTKELIEVIASEDRICKYLDIPLQHISDHLLQEMNRNFTRKETVDLIKRIRKTIPEVRLRTTFVVGLPGETEQDFDELMTFVKDTRFERVGVFKYSREEGTAAYDMPDQVSESIKTQRFDALMNIQQDVCKFMNRQFIGKTLKILIDEQHQDDKNVYVGRSAYDAPDVDGVVYVHSKRNLSPGDFVDTIITDAYEYDLIGDAV